MSNVNCIVYKDFKRPDKQLIERFRGIPAANLDDCMGRQAAADAAIKPIGKSGLIGPALTVKVTEGDNLMFHYAMDLAKEGDVIVIDAGGSTSRSIFGEIMVHYLLKKNIGGIIVDGALRDKEDIAATGLPVYAKGVTPDGPWKNGPGTVNTPVVCGEELSTLATSSLRTVTVLSLSILTRQRNCFRKSASSWKMRKNLWMLSIKQVN